MSKINRFANAGRAMITKFYGEAMEATKAVEGDMKEKMFLAQMERLIGDISKPNKKKNAETLLFFTSMKNLIMDQAKIVYHNPACFDLPEVNEMGPSFTLGGASENGAYSEAEPAGALDAEEDAVSATEEDADHGAASDAEEAAVSEAEEDADHGAASDAEEVADHGAASDAEEAAVSETEEAADHGAFSEAEPVEEEPAAQESDSEFFSDAEHGEASPKRLKPTME
jgi:hypothetical protein